MAADLTSVIENSLANAGLTGGDADGDGGDIAGSESTPAPEQGADGTSESQADAAPGPSDETGAPAAEGDPAPPVDAEASEAPAEPAVPVAKKGPIPFQKHEKILANERTKHKSEIDALNTRLQSVAWAESAEAQARVQAMGAAETHPELFAKAILGDERLGPIFRRLVAGDAAAPAAAAPAVGTDRPKPNVQDKDGNLGYDEAGLAALLDWTALQATQQALKAYEEKWGKQLDPLLQDRKKAEAWKSDVAQADKVIKAAQSKWHGFKEAQAEIKAYLEANVTASLEDAYQAVVVTRLRTDRAKIRDEVLAEMNGKKRVAQPRPAATTAAPVGGKRSIEDVIKQSIAHLEG